MITEKTNVWRSGLSSLAKGLARVLPGSGPKKQSGSNGAFLAVFSAFATLSLLFTPNTTLAQDDEGPAALTVSFGADSYTAIENGADAQVMISLDQPADRAVSIPLNTSPATGPYSVAFSTVDFDVGEQHRTIAVTATNDDKDLNNQTVTLSFGARPAGVSVGTPSSARVTLWDDDLKALNISFGRGPFVARENGGAVTVPITLDSATDRDLRIPITATPDSTEGTLAADFTLSANEVVFPAGQSRQTITVKANDDDDLTVDSVELGFNTPQMPFGVSVRAEDRATAEVTLTDDNFRVVQFDANKFTAVENASPTPVTVTVNVSPAPAGDVAIGISVSPAPARQNPDFSHTITGNSVTVGTGGSTTFTVSALEDDDMTSEKITFRITNLPPGSYRVGKNSSTVVTLQDEDLPDPTMVFFDSATQAPISEGGTRTVGVTLNPPSDEDVTVTLTPTIAGTTAADGDYQLNGKAPPAAGIELKFAAGERRKTVTVTSKADADLDNETVTLTLSNLVSDDAQATLTGAQTTTTVTINDDRKQTVTIAAAPAVINESDVTTTSTVTVTLNPAPVSPATVNIPITVSPGSGDFTLTGLANRRVSIDSTGSATFTIAPKADQNTTDQTVTFGFGGLPGNVKLGAAATRTAKVAVRDATRPILSFGAAGYPAIENGDAATVEITLSPASDETVVVPLTTAPATGGDFLLSTREVVFAAGEQRKTVTVTAAQDDDTAVDSVTLSFGAVTVGGEAVTLTDATAPVTTNGGQATTIVTLVDDGLSVVTITGGGNLAAGATQDLTVTISGTAPTADLTIPITVNPAPVKDGNFEITAPANFKNAVTITSGISTATITVQANADDNDTNDKVVFGLGAMPINARAGQPSSTTVTLTEPGSTTVPTLSFGGAAYTAIEGGATATIPVTLDPVSDEDVTVVITGSLPTDTDADAFSSSLPNDGELEFKAGESRKTITVTAIEDTDTTTEVITLGFGTVTSDDTTVSGTAGAQITATVTLVDDGVAKNTISFSANQEVVEGTPATVTVTLSAGPATGESLTVPITMKPGSGDFILSPPRRVIFGEGETTQTITITTTADMDVESDDLVVELGFGQLPTNLIAGENGTHKVTFTDDDRQVLVAGFHLDAYEVDEGKDVKVRVNLTLSDGSALPKDGVDRDVTIPITVDDSTPAAGTGTADDDDYSLSAMSVTFNKGDKGNKTITFTANENADANDGTNEIVVLGLGPAGKMPAGVSVGTAAPTATSTTVTIDDDHDALAVGFINGTSFGAHEGGSSATIEVVVSPAVDRDVMIPIQTNNLKNFSLDGVTGSGRNYKLALKEKDTSALITVMAEPDADIEDQVLTLTLGMPAKDMPEGVTAATTVGTLTTVTSVSVTLVDNKSTESTVSFGAATYEAMEDGDAATVVINLVPPLPSGARNTYTIPVSGWPMDGAAPEDFMLSADSVTFGPGEGSKSITVTAVDNNVPKSADGTVKLIFGAMPGDALPEGVTAGDNAETTVTLVDDDRNEMLVAYFMPATATAAEGGDAGTVSVGLDLGEGIASLDREITLPITVSSDADEGDYTVDTMMVTFPAGATAGAEVWAPITVTANLDDDNDSETVTLGLGTLPLGVTAGSTAEQSATATVTLEDDGQAALTVAFGEAEASAMEGGDAATVTVSLSAASDRDITIPITATAAEGSDGSYELSAMEVMFAAGDMSQTITVTASYDEDTEDGMVTLGLGDLPAHVTAGDQATTAVSLVDDGLVPLAVSFGAATYSATEGGNAVSLAVLLNRSADREITIPITMDPADGPYDLSVSEVTFAVGQRGQNITITAVEDDDITDDMVTLGFDLSGLERVNMGEQATTVVTLADDMLVPVTVSFGAANYTATEGGAAATVMVSLDKAPARSVTIPITTDPASGSFELSANQVTFAANETSQEVTVMATLDADQDDGSVTLGLGDLPDRVSAGAITSSMVALADDGLVPVAVSFDAAEYSAMEGGDAATVTVNLSADPKRDVTIGIAATPATGDFEISAMEVMFSAGNMSQTITVMATLDADVDDDMVNLSLVNMPDRVTAGANTSAAVTLVDDGLVPVVVSFDASEYSATEGGAAATVTVNLDQDPNRDVTVPITTDPANGDFELSASEVMFSAGNMSQTITVTATSDDDVDDEMVMLGLGDLPSRVSAGDPATAAVSLIDKGYTVTFATARQTVRESERGTVTANISPSAVGQVSVPLSVTHQGGASAADYSGVPGSLAFNAGSNQASFTVSVMADEENDPGESIDVSFGSLPDKVNAGDLTMTTVEFEQFRTAEQFSSTLQAALAVVAGAMGDSAINAIEGRFERYRESMGNMSALRRDSERTYGHWSDMESPGMAMTGHQQGYTGLDNGFVPMATTTPGTGLTAGSTGYGRSHTSGSYEEAIALGALVNTARPGESVIASGYSMAPNSEQDVSFSGVAFEMAMEHGDEGKFSPIVWVQGDLQRFDGEVEDIGMDFDGGLDAIHLGVDLYANGQTLAGVSLMQSWGDLDYTDDGVDGSLDSSMSTFHPYVYFQANQNLGVWGILGFGSGSVDVSEPDRTHEFDADFSMFAGGVRSVLNRRDNNELGLSADAFMAELSTDAADDISGVSGEAQRARVMVDWLSNSTMEAGQDFSWKAEIGGRFDGGDGIEGAGIEAGFRAGLVDSDQGLDVALGARALLLHENDASDYGIGVQVTWDPGEKRKGMVASLGSSYGQDRGGSTSLWDNGNAMNPIGSMWQETQVRVDGEIGYAGMLTPFGLPGTVMPYSRARFSGYGQEFGVGTRWTPAETSSTDSLLPATFELEGLTRETRTGLSDLALVLRMSIPFGGEKAVEPRHSRNRAVNEAAMGPTVSTAYPETETTGAE